MQDFMGNNTFSINTPKKYRKNEMIIEKLVFLHATINKANHFVLIT